MIIKNMFRLDEEEELLEMTLAAEMVLIGTIAPTQEFNKIKYEKKISANKENGAVVHLVEIKMQEKLRAEAELKRLDPLNPNLK